jgi:restriction system protein
MNSFLILGGLKSAVQHLANWQACKRWSATGLDDASGPDFEPLSLSCVGSELKPQPSWKQGANQGFGLKTSARKRIGAAAVCTEHQILSASPIWYKVDTKGRAKRMARRKKTSGAEDLMDLVAMLPWWAGLGLALISYVLLHRVAVQVVVVPTQIGQMSTMVGQTLWKTFASIGQYLLPLICLAGAGISAWRRQERKKLVVDVAQSQASDALDGMTWREFEMLVGEGFRLQGYKVVESGGGGPDGGIDLVLTKPGKNGGEKFLVQCKQWRAYKVGVDVVRELYGVMAAKGATGGFVVTSGRFTADAVEFASGRNVRLIDGPKLHNLLRQAKAGADRPPATPSQAARPIRPVAAPDARASAAPESASSCPLCAKPMTRRTAKRGTNAGREFWGCAGYPACRGTRPFV